MTKPKRIFLLFPIFLLFLSLIFPQEAASGVKKGVSLALQGALPSLFPALVLSKMITFCFRGMAGKKAVFILFFLGLLSGFPMGAVGAASLYKARSLTKKEAETMLFFCNHAGPAFLVGFCGNAMFGNAKIGWFLFFWQTFFAFFFLFLFFGKKFFKKEKKETNALPSPSIPLIITASLREAAESFLYIASCIIFFSFIIELILHLFPLPPLPKAVVCLFLELTSGCKALSPLPKKTALLLLAAGCGWNGLSVHLQGLSFLLEANLSVKKYFLGKVIFSVLLTFAMFFLQKLL